MRTNLIAIAAWTLMLMLAAQGAKAQSVPDPSTYAIDQLNEATALEKRGHSEDAKPHFEAAARAGNPSAQFTMGVLAETRARQSAIDPGNVYYLQARDWYQLAAAQSFAPALNNLGALYFDGRGVARDVDEAARLYRAAANAGNAQGAYNLALLIARGQITADRSEAVVLLTASAASGFANAQAQLAKFYLDGELVEKNPVEAARLFELAAEQDHVQAEYYLAMMLRTGEGIKKDPAAAFAWMSIAAGHDLPVALSAKASMLERGEGVAANDDAANAVRTHAAALIGATSGEMTQPQKQTDSGPAH